MTIEQIKKLFDEYEAFKDLAYQKFAQYSEENKTVFPFYKATAKSYDYHHIDFDTGNIVFVMDDFYNGYDLHDYDYKSMPISYLVEKNDDKEVCSSVGQ